MVIGRRRVISDKDRPRDTGEKLHAVRWRTTFAGHHPRPITPLNGTPSSANSGGVVLFFPNFQGSLGLLSGFQ